MKITILTGNPVCKTNPLNDRSEQGLSLFIEFHEKIILFNSGESDLFIHNAENMGVNLSKVDYLVISYGYFGYSGALKQFLKINNKAKIFLHIKAAHKFYTRIFGFIPYHMGFSQKIIGQNSRIYFIEEDTQIEDKLILLEGFQEGFPHPEEKREFFEKTKHRFPIDKFEHELAMLLIENDEIVLFSGCSYSGIVNIIEEVKLFSKTMRIKATFSVSHFNNPLGANTEGGEYIEPLTEAPGETVTVSHNLHFPGETNFFLNKGRIGRKIQTMYTGEVFIV
jgi:7,8-dihydropterin-6-yl-methyl-4-(beta-D-ribofuranosyl)aminobenzene 5'-phosphate synthase